MLCLCKGLSFAYADVAQAYYKYIKTQKQITNYIKIYKDILKTI